MYDLILKNCKIVNENKIIESDIAIKNNRIELIQASIDSESKKIVDVDGKYVLPGLIDDQVHFREPGLTHKGDIATESRAGLAGGVTSYFEMPNVNPTTTTNENLSKKFDIASTKSRSNYSFHLGASNTNIEEIKRVDINQAAALKVFMGASTGEMLVDSLDALDDIFNYSPLIVVTHCEDQTTVKNNEKLFLERYGDDLSAQHHHLIRDVESCYLSSSLAVGLAKKYDSDLHVFHLTTEKEMELFTPGAVNGKKITSEVCVHHMHFNETDYAELGNQIKCNPSIKEESDRLALIKALHEDNETEFLGYESLESESKILVLWKDQDRVDEAKESEEIFIACDRTPFYGESGGQVGDSGRFISGNTTGTILDCKKQGKVYLHRTIIEKGNIKTGDVIKMNVEKEKRSAIAIHHSATHLVHAALREVLGDHVQQKGSLVDENKLRFDFSHSKAVSKEEIHQIELMVNQYILKNLEVTTKLMKLDDALKIGAEAMFGEKYVTKLT